MHGLQAVERAKDWYHKQIAAVQDKMKYLGRTNSHTVSLFKIKKIFNSFILLLINCYIYMY